MTSRCFLSRDTTSWDKETLPLLHPVFLNFWIKTSKVFYSQPFPLIKMHFKIIDFIIFFVLDFYNNIDTYVKFWVIWKSARTGRIDFPYFNNCICAKFFLLLFPSHWFVFSIRRSSPHLKGDFTIHNEQISNE